MKMGLTDRQEDLEASPQHIERNVAETPLIKRRERITHLKNVRSRKNCCKTDVLGEGTNWEYDKIRQSQWWVPKP
jgi:hypothetical protein